MGRVAARYYVDYETCEAFAKKLPPGASDTIVRGLAWECEKRDLRTTSETARFREFYHES